MINTKKLYNTILSDATITALVPADNIMSAYPAEVEVYPCIIFLDENQSDGEYNDNKAGSSDCSVNIHVFSKKLDGYYSTSDIAEKICSVMNADLWHCSKNGEVTDPDPDTEHRVLFFSKSIYNN